MIVVVFRFSLVKELFWEKKKRERERSSRRFKG